MRLCRRSHLLLVSFACASIIYLYQLSRSPLFNQYEIVRNYQQRQWTESNDTRTILLWNSFFTEKRWNLSADTLNSTRIRDELQCPIFDCVITNQRDFLTDVSDYDAVVFHVAEPFPFFQKHPYRRSAKQVYVFALMEPPGETKHELHDEQHFYNLTMSYRLDSDIIWLYRYMLHKITNGIVAPSIAPHWHEPPANWSDAEILRLWPGKVRLAAWFVSHCQTLSRRELLAQALQLYMPVDVYGKCGTWVCKRDSVECDDLLNSEYKFYFAFENALCTDYITEKVYYALEHYVIPVVYGGADYARFLPPHSYINVEDFASVEHLAKYLNYVANDVAAFMRYFWWRDHYKLGNVSPFCQLCQQLHSATLQQKMQTYVNIEEWWLGSQSCRYEAKNLF